MANIRPVTEQGKQERKSAPPTDVDAYLATVPDEARAALEQLRQTIKAAAPDATEVISYRIPTFKLHGRPLVAFSASKSALGMDKWSQKNHCAFHLMSPPLMEALKGELKPYDTTTATIRFSPSKPLPAALVTKLVNARIEENEASQKGYGKRSRAKVSTTK